jgi:hypothetical protein
MFEVRAMHIIRVVVTLAVAFVVCDASLAQNSSRPPVLKHEFTLEDLEKFHAMDLRMRPVGNDLAGFMGNPPMQAGLEAADRTENCMVRLASTYDAFTRSFNEIESMIGLSARMLDAEDLLLVNRVLGNDVSAFLAEVKDYQTMLNATVRICSQDGATIAKAQEIRRLFKEATALVEAAAKRLGVSALKVP